MELLGNLRMVHVPILIIWLATLLLSVVSYAYPLTPSADVDDDVYDSERPVYEDVNWVRSLSTSPDLRLSESRASVNEFPENRERKRIPFGFSGLDNLDHIMTTLDRTPKPAQQSEKDRERMDRDIYYLMKVNG